MTIGERSLSPAQPARKGFASSLAVMFGLLGLALLAFLPASPWLLPSPGAEIGESLSVSAELLAGRVLYRDVWQNSPPLFAFLNTLGLALGGAEAWGNWLMALASIGGATLLLYTLLKGYFGPLPAGFAAAGFLGNLIFVLQRGISPEVYGLPLQIGAFLLLARGVERPHSAQSSRINLWALAAGVLVGLAGSLRLSLQGLGVTAALFLLAAAVWEHNGRRLLDVVWVALGAALVWGAWAAYFTAQHALADLVDQVFRYNLLFSGVTNLDRVGALKEVLLKLYACSGFFALGLLAWLVVIPFLFVHEARFREILASRWTGAAVLALGIFLLVNGLLDDRTGRFFALSSLSAYRIALVAAGLAVCAASAAILSGWVRGRIRKFVAYKAAAGGFAGRRLTRAAPGLLLPLFIALLDLPVQFGFASLAGSRLFYNYAPLLPSLAILIAFLAWAVLSGQGFASAGQNARQNAVIWLAVLALPVLATGWFASLSALRVSRSDQALQAAEEIQKNTLPGERLLQWGANGQLYFLADRLGVGSYLDQRALFTPGYSDSERIGAFLLALQANPPAILVDTRPESGMPLVLPGAEGCANLGSDAFIEQRLRQERDSRFPMLVDEPLPYLHPEMKNVYRWLCEHYELTTPLSTDLDAWRIYRFSSTGQ